MSSNSGDSRKPLSPVKSNAGRTPASSKNGKLASLEEAPSPDVFSSPFIGQPPPTILATKRSFGKRQSRIPRATPSPEATAVKKASSHVKQRVDIPTKIPRFAVSTPISDPLSIKIPAGFSAYVNPGFSVDGRDMQEGTAATSVHPRLDTPAALQIIHKVGGNGLHKQIHQDVQNITNALLRTGPQKLSPEPSRDYCISAPKPAALPGHAAVVSTLHNDTAAQNEENENVEGSPPGSNTPVTDIARVDSNDPNHPSSVCSCAALVEHSEAPEPVAALNPHASSPVPSLEVIIADPVNSAGHIDSTSSPPGVADAPTNEAAPRTLSVVSPAAPEESTALPPSCVVSPVTLNFPSSGSPHPKTCATAATTERRLEGRKVGEEEAATTRGVAPATSTSSFSFGMGGVAAAADGDPTPVGAAQHEAETLGAQRERRDHRNSSGDSVDQPNPFASMLFHLKEGGPAAYASPARHGGHEDVAQWEIEGTVARGESVMSPQSPDQCTPLGLLPEGVPQSSTPELGKGDLQAWIDRRGMRGILNSPAVADLRQLWRAVREGAGAQTAAEKAAAEADALRRELAVAREALEKLSSEHASAMSAAAVGREWAEAEVERARSAASHMMALADQIQATFAMCEQEKSSLAEELEVSLVRAEAAERQASSAAAHAAASEEQLLMAASLQRELDLAQQAAEGARREAVEAKEVAAASAQELIAIREQLLAAQRALSEQEPSSDNCRQGAASPANGITPITSLRMQLHSVHDALAVLHAASKVQGEAGSCVSPHVTRMLAASDHGMSKAGRLLEEDAMGLETANAHRRELVAELHARAEQLSPSGTPVPLEHGQAMQTAPKEDDVTGTVTVDFQELHEALHARFDGEPFPAGSAGPTCSMDVDGVVVTNIPESHMSQVRSMVTYFESLVVQADDTPGGGSAFNAVAASDGEESSFEVDEAEVAAIEAEMRESACASNERVENLISDANGDIHSIRDCPPVVSMSPATFSGMSGALPPGVPITPLFTGPAADARSNGEQVAMACIPPPPAPSCTPADGITPLEQRRHIRTMDALAALRVGHEVATTEIGHSADQQEQQRPSPSPYATEKSTPPVESFHREITPFDVEAALKKNGPGSALRGEVKARLEKLKSELHAARNKLQQVDRGLAAIVTPKMTGNGPYSSSHAVPVSNCASAPGDVPRVTCLGASSADHGTPGPAVVAAPAPTPKTRPSVRFADSVKGGSAENRPLRPGTPATASINGAATLPAVREGVSDAFSVEVGDRAVQSGLHAHPAAAGPAASISASVGDRVAPSPASATPLRRLNLEPDSEDDSDDDDEVHPGTSASSSSRMAIRVGTPLNQMRSAGINPGHGHAATPLTHAESRFFAATGPLNSTPGFSRFSSVSSSSFSPSEPVTFLAVRPVGRVRGRGAMGNGRRPSESEEREFRRRAAALKIHVSPYFKKRGGAAQRDPGDDSSSLIL